MRNISELIIYQKNLFYNLFLNSFTVAYMYIVSLNNKNKWIGKRDSLNKCINA